MGAAGHYSLSTEPHPADAGKASIQDVRLDVLKSRLDDIATAQREQGPLIRKAERSGRVVIDLIEHWRDVQSAPGMSIRKSYYNQPEALPETSKQLAVSIADPPAAQRDSSSKSLQGKLSARP